MHCPFTVCAHVWDNHVRAVPPVGNDRLIHPGGVMVAAGLRVWLVPQGVLEKRV